MIPEKSKNSVEINGNLDTTGFGIDSEDFSHLVDLIQNQLYSNKPLALIREYSCNAYDANVVAGRGNVPIKITLPGRFAPQLKIRDFGDGLNDEQMKKIFTRYGKSTKRNDNTTVGCFGIGSKSAFAYTPSFMVNSYIDGIKYCYNCVLDETNVGKLVDLGKYPTDEANGVEIIINIQRDDIDTFRGIVMDFFKYWDVLPEVEGFTADDYAKMRDTSEVPISGTGWKLTKSNNGYGRDNTSIAIMGNIAYPISWGSVKGYKEMIDKHCKSNYYARHFITENRFIFNFGIGEVKMSPSRETLQYTELTNNAIVARLEVVFSEIAANAQAKIDAMPNLWEAKKLYSSLFGNSTCLYYLRDSITLNYKGKAIENAMIGNFKQYAGVLKTYNRRSGNTNFYGYDCGDYAWNNIECSDRGLILEIDQTDKIYIQKAVQHLAAKHNINTVFTLKFPDAATRSKVFSEMGLDDSFITKYSTIAADVEATIIRGANKGVTFVKKDSTMRSLRYASSANLNNRYLYNYNVTDLPQQDVDMTAGGIYIETTNNVPNNNLNMQSALNDIVNLSKVAGNELVVHFIGQNYMGSSLMSKGNWVKFTDYVKTKMDEIYTANANITKNIAYRTVMSDNDIIKFKSEFMTLAKKAVKCDLLKEAFSYQQQNDSDKPEVVLMTKYNKVNTADVKAIKDLFVKIKEKYPLIEILNNYGVVYDNNTKKAVTDYLTLCA